MALATSRLLTATQPAAAFFLERGSEISLAGGAGLSAVLHATLVSPGSMDLLFGVSMLDPLTFIGLSVFAACLAGLATLIPARRAISVNPVAVLRYE